MNFIRTFFEQLLTTHGRSTNAGTPRASKRGEVKHSQGLPAPVITRLLEEYDRQQDEKLKRLERTAHFELEC